MGISAVSSSTNLDVILSAQAALRTTSTAKPAGGGGKPSGAAMPAASTASGTSSASDNGKIYDVRDTNKDGVVSYMEALLYSFKHPGEATSNQATGQSNTEQNTAIGAASGKTSTINLSV